MATRHSLKFDCDLTLPRQKKVPLSIRIGYRLIALSKRIVGRELLMRLTLNAAWFFWRIAFELAGEYFDSSFSESSSCTTASTLAKWIPAQSTVLELGCSSGRVSRMLARYAKRVVSIDRDENALQLARQIAERENTTNIEYRVGDIRNPLRGEHFDLAVLVHVLEMIEEADALLTDLKEVTNTLLVEVTDFEADSLNYVRRHLGCIWFADGSHVRESTEDSMRAQLERNGWQTIYCDHRRGSITLIANRT